MDLAVLDWLLGQTGIAVFAALALLLMWRQQRDGILRERENSEIHRQDKGRVIDALEGVTRSNTELCMLIRELRSDMKERTT